MFIRALLLAATATLLSCASQTDLQRGRRPSGINAANFDTSVRPQDEFYQHAVGGWLKSNEIPPYLSHWSTSSELQVRIYEQLRGKLEALVSARDHSDADRRKLADLYASYMNESGIEAAGLRPLRAELERADQIANHGDVAATLARFIRIGVDVPLSISIHPDSKDAARNIADLGQAGLSLPDRDYYLSDQPRFKTIRAEYLKHIQTVLELAGRNSAAEDAAAILAFETKLAAAHWTNVANRDPVATYNLVELSGLPKLAPGLDWQVLIAGSGLQGRTQHVNVSQPSYFTTLGQLAEATPLAVWRAYFVWRLVDQLSPYLPKAFAAEGNAFYGATLGGVTVGRPRWLRAIGFIDDSMGDALGRVYIEQYFPPHAEERARELMDNLLAAFRHRIDQLDWMGAESKKEAHAKLDLLRMKFGYPSKWRDYSSLRTSSSDLVGNLMALRAFAYERDLAKLGQPVDRDEWRMTPQTVNGYYSAWRNEVVLPAALMQPPYFQADADDAVNYGGFGWFVAHELSHAFDNGGSKFDGKGNLRDWMAREDQERFMAKTHALVEQYSRYEAAAGFSVSGELTLGENIADVAGLAIAYEAYRLSLKGAPASVIDGLTGDQRFLLSYATIWAGKDREADAIARSKSDTHSPRKFRVNGAVVNQDSFHEAFDVKESDRMYLPPGQRVRIW